MAISKQARTEAFARLLNYFTAYLPTADEKPLFVDRDKVADTCAVDVSIVGRALLSLERSGFIVQACRSNYYALPTLPEATAQQLEEMYQTYSVATRNRAIERALAEPDTKKVFEAFPALGIIELFNSSQTPAAIDVQEAPQTGSYGYQLTPGMAWFNTPEEAAQAAQKHALSIGVESLDIVKKVGVIENRPTIVFY